MKPYLTFILIFVFSLTSFAQTASTSAQSNHLEEIRILNEQVVKLYNEKKLDEAITAGRKIQEIAAANNLNNDPRVLVALGNLAELYLAKEKYSEAVAAYRIVSDGYEKIGDKRKPEFEKAISRLAFAYTSKKDYKNAEAEYLKLKTLTETNHGEKSRQSANLYLQLANFYSLQKKEDAADDYFLKAILINDDILSDKEKETREDVNVYTCSLYHRAFQKDGLKDGKALLDDVDKKRGISPDNNLNLGIINGKAKNLAIPHYPQSARNKRASGFAIVKVDIDEQGKVTKAKAYCGFLDFVTEVENAAMKSTFTPTLENGVPVKVTGDIVYKFVAQ